MVFRENLADCATLLRQPSVDVDAYDANGATLTYIAAAHGRTNHRSLFS